MDAAATARLAGTGLSIGVVVVVVDLDERAAALDLLVALATAIGLLPFFFAGAVARAGDEERAAFALAGGLAFLVDAAFFDDLATETPTPLIALNATTFADRKQSGFTAS